MANQPPPEYSEKSPYPQGAPPGQPPQGGYAPPPQGGYAPPPQGGYAPPPQGGYAPPPQGGYAPPAQPGYPTQQPGNYPPQTHGHQPYQPVPTSYPASQPQGYSNTSTTTTIIAAQPSSVTTMAIIFNQFPVSMTCPSCRAQIVTAVSYELGTYVYLLFFLMCFLGLWICCFIPCCMDGCKDSVHSCPNCHTQLGVYRRM